MSEQSQTKTTILLVEDDQSVRRGLRWSLGEGYRLLEAGTRMEAAELLEREKVDVVLSDLRLPPALDEISEGLAVVEAARKLHPPVPVIVVTGSDSKQAALEAVRNEMPVDPPTVRALPVRSWVGPDGEVRTAGAR